MTVSTVPVPHVRVLWRPEQFTRITNPGFETNTTGWAVTAGVNAAGTSITRITTDFYAGAACAQVVTTATAGSGCNFDLGADTYFTEATYGTVYAALVWLKRTSGSRKVKLVLGSEGTTSDRATLNIDISDSWQPYRVLWMPTGNRTDVQLAITNGSLQAVTFKVDQVSVYQVDAFSQCENSNFPADTTGWDIGAGNIAGAATSLTQGTGDGMDPATQTYATLVTTSTSGSGADFPLGVRKFTSGRTYRLLCALKSVSGTTSARLRLGSVGTGADRGDSSITITTSWALYSVDWTASGDRTDACLAVSNGAASVMTTKVGFVEVYETLDEISANGSNELASATWKRGDNFDSSSSSPGTITLTVRDVATASAATSHKFTPWNTAGPLSGSLEPGRRVWGRATYSGSIYPLFYGTIRQIVPRPYDGQADILAEDPLYDMNEAVTSVAFEGQVLDDPGITYAASRASLFGRGTGLSQGASVPTMGARRLALTSTTPESGYYYAGSDGPVSLLGYLDALNEATQTMHWVHPHCQAEYLWQYTTEARTTLSDATVSDETFNDDFTMLTGLTATDEQLENTQVVPWQTYEWIIVNPGTVLVYLVQALDPTQWAAADDDDPYLHFTDDRYGTDDVPEPMFRRETLKHWMHRKHYHPGKGKRFRTRGGNVYLNGSVVGKLNRGRRIYPGAFVPFTIPAGDTFHVVIDTAVPMEWATSNSWVSSSTGDDAYVVQYSASTPHQMVLDFVGDGTARMIDALDITGTAYMPLAAEDVSTIDSFSVLDKGQHAGPGFSTPYIASAAQARGIGQYRNWRYGSARLRPRLETQNRFPTALQREVADHLTVTGGRFSISGKVFLVHGIEMGVAVGTGGLDWHHFMDLEEIPTAPGTWLVIGTHKPDGTKYLMA